MENFFSPYSICAACAVAATAVALFLLARNRRADLKLTFVGFLFALVGLFLGAHLLFFIVGLPDFIAEAQASPFVSLDNFISRFLGASSGMVFYGGLFGALVGVNVFIKVNKLPALPWRNLLVCVFPLFHGIARIGCAISGCCYGIEYHGPLAIQYTEAAISPGLNDDIADFPRFPVQPLEALCELILFVIILLLFRKKGNTFSVTIVYFTAYAVIRFLDEFLRGDSLRGLWGPFSTSQWISLGVLAFMLIYFLVKYFPTRRRRQA